MTIVRARSHATAWFSRWRAILPLLLSELIVWLGFGALLPILPIYFVQHGIDLGTLGLVVAAWPGARLVAEPIFGWLADRTVRVPLMVFGLVAAGVVTILPLVWATAPAFVAMRALTGLATAIYDPAARGYIVDATPSERQGEAFGLYGAAQMGGLLLGPAIGGLGAAVTGGLAFAFVLGALSSLASGVVVVVLVREQAHKGRSQPIPVSGLAELRTGAPGTSPAADRSPAPGVGGDRSDDRDEPATPEGRPRPSTLRNRLLVAAVIVNIGGFFAAGTYEVIWSLYLRSLGAGLDLIGLTFATFGLAMLVVSPIAGRLVDRGGALPFVIGGALAAATTGVIYTLIANPVLTVPVLLVEGSAFALLNPALYSIVARGSPEGRTSTAQGLFGAAGTVGFIVASLCAGYLAQIDLHYPFYLFTTVMLTCLTVAMLVGWRSIADLGVANRPSLSETGG